MQERFLYTYPDRGRFRIAVCYPNDYHSGMSSLGFQALFHRVSSFPGIRCARFFIERDGALFSPEASNPRKLELFPHDAATLRFFDAAFFSISFELDYINALRMLRVSGLPLLAAERMEPAGAQSRKSLKPFLLAGGISVTANPFIMAPFADAVFRGDMEEGLERIIEALVKHSFEKNEALLSELADIGGLYVTVLREDAAFREGGMPGTPAGAGPETEPATRPGRGTHIPERVTCGEVREPAHSAVLTRATEFSGMFLVETTRGCAHTCVFCLTRCVSHPMREIRSELILELVRRALPHTKKVGLVGPVLTDHSGLAVIVSGINALGGIVSFSSLRAEHFTEELGELFRHNRQRSVTFAPETGSPRLRRLIGKPADEELFMRAVKTALEHGVKRVRYYLMYGIPDESDEDVSLTVGFVRRTLELFRNTGASLHLSINPLIPKKGTPFETRSIFPLEYYRMREAQLRKAFGGEKQLYVRFEPLRFLYAHFLLSTGGEEAAMELHRSLTKGSLREGSLRDLDMFVKNALCSDRNIDQNTGKIKDDLDSG